MWCFKYRKWLGAYIDDELDQKRIEILEKHLTGCSRCSKELAELREQWSGLAEMEPPPSTPVGLRASILDSLEKREKSSWLDLRRELVFQTACAVVCFIIGFAGGAMLSWQKSPENSVIADACESEMKLVSETFNSTVFGPDYGKEGVFRCVPR